MNIELQDASHGPAYAQVRDQIESLIRSGAIPSGEALTAPVVLARKLSVDRGEIIRAYFELERSGLVKKEMSKDFLGQQKTVYRAA